MIEIKGAFRVTKNAFINTHYSVLLLNDSMLFVKTGSELSGHDVHPLKESDLERISGQSKEEILSLNKKNFIINYDEIISLNLKKSVFGLNGPQTGILTITGRKTYKYVISPFQDFNTIEQMFKSIIPNKLDTLNSYKTKPLSSPSAQKYQVITDQQTQNRTADKRKEVSISPGQRSFRSGATWLFIIAGLSIVNYIFFLTGGDSSFLVGLAFTQFMAVFAGMIGGNVSIWATIITLFFAAIFIICGVYAYKGKTWAFIIAIVVYGLDTCLFLLVKDWLSIAFHIFALVFIILGARACFKSNKSRKNFTL